MVCSQWVEVGQGLVHQQHLGLHGQGAGQQHALALATRQLRQRAVAPVPGLRGAQRLLHGGMVGSTWRGQPGLVRQTAQHGHVIAGEVVGRAFVLSQPGQLAGAFARGDLRQRAAQQLHFALHGCVRQQARQHLEQGGLARTVGADNAGPAPGGQLQVDALQYEAISDACAYLACADSY
jgi:hypothetical protein